MSLAGKRGSSAPAMRCAFLGAIAVLATLALPAAAGASARAAPGDCTTSKAGNPSPLDGVCEYLDARKGVVQVALFDHDSGRLYALSTGDDKQYTASIVKVGILGEWLHAYQLDGVEIPDGIGYSIKYLMQRMIENSDNAAATSLFHFGGGCDALTRFDALLPLDSTEVACESPTYYGWGNTTTTAADQVRMMKVFAYGKPKHVLGQDARSYGRQLMESVEPAQRFGVTCGPWGTACDAPDFAPPDADVTVALKNGWKTLPTCTQPVDQCPWQVNSIGSVNGRGRNYVLAVLTTHDPAGSGLNYGIDTIQHVSQRIWSNLSP
jgi:Beta-lactamase enzyme family